MARGCPIREGKTPHPRRVEGGRGCGGGGGGEGRGRRGDERREEKGRAEGASFRSSTISSARPQETLRQSPTKSSDY